MITFNAAEILEMAQGMERDGAEFYRQAATSAAGVDSGEMLLKLAAMEDDHERTFAALADSLPPADRGQTAFDPEGVGAMYLQALVDGTVFKPPQRPVERLKGMNTVGEILTAAIELEKESILFYMGMKAAGPAASTQDAMEKIIGEEMGHVSVLQEALKEQD